MSGERQFALCGLSSRALSMFVRPLLDNPQWGKVVGILDIDQQRVEAFLASQRLSLPFYPPEGFQRMVEETHPDAIIVTSPDSSHVDYTVAALEAGLAVLCEKPMVTDCAQAARVLEAEQHSSGSLRVTHNSRYALGHTLIKRWIHDGRIGRVTNIELTWNLDTYHGASYFWRWNRLRRMSGGLTITKACHHFDLLNWWLDDVPEQVFAFGARNFYGPESPHNPSRRDHTNYSREEQMARCPYSRRWGGAVRDDHLQTRGSLPYTVQYPLGTSRYLFDEEIDIEDTCSAVIRYHGGASVSYSLNASAAWEGYTLGVNGTHGRIETRHYTSPTRLPFDAPAEETLTLQPLFGEGEQVQLPLESGEHGGSDQRLRNSLFAGEPDRDGLGLVASGLEGAYAVAIGEAVWRSVTESKPIAISDLLQVHNAISV